MVTRKHFALVLTGSVVFLLVCLCISPLIGPESIDLHNAIAHRHNITESPDSAILFLARLPRILFAALAGAALAGAGVAFQALLRNPLATPYTLGVSSGVACGAVAGILFGFDTVIWGIPGIQMTGLAGALLTVWFVYFLGKKTGGSTHTLLLAGVTLSFFFAALIMLMQYLADMTQTYRIVNWLMGSLDLVEYQSIFRAIPGVVISLLLLWSRSAEYNILSMGYESAQSRGVDVRRNTLITYLGASYAVATVVSVTGPIGFVGLIVPHIIRVLFGSDHRLLFPVSCITGAGFLILCDTAARTILAPSELPVGVLTALLGGPFFLFILLKKRPC